MDVFLILRRSRPSGGYEDIRRVKSPDASIIPRKGQLLGIDRVREGDHNPLYSSYEVEEVRRFWMISPTDELVRVEIIAFLNQLTGEQL